MEVAVERLDDVESYVIGRRIVLDSDLYPPRRNWRFCHELAHILLGHTDIQMINPEMEREADASAVELMLPIAEFRQAMKEMDIPALKERFPHASWEVIARRWINERQAVLTIYDNGRLTGRYAPEDMAFPARPGAAEIDLVRECSEKRQHLRRGADETEGLDLQAYFVDDGRGVERVLLLTEPSIEDLS